MLPHSSYQSTSYNTQSGCIPIRIKKVVIHHSSPLPLVSFNTNELDILNQVSTPTTSPTSTTTTTSITTPPSDIEIDSCSGSESECESNSSGSSGNEGHLDQNTNINNGNQNQHKHDKKQEGDTNRGGYIEFRYDIQIMMVTSGSGGSWVFPKGSVKKGESLLEAAKRETFEESGIKGKVMKRIDPIQVADHSKQANLTYYLLYVTKKKKQFDEKDVRRRVWYSLSTVLHEAQPMKTHIQQVVVSIQRIMTIFQQQLLSVPRLTNVNTNLTWKMVKKDMESILLFNPEKERKKQMKKLAKQKEKSEKQQQKLEKHQQKAKV